ncbi:hypothetical protein [Candidatus Hepatoplasma crinochetorum]|uniref:hypothetical protein n=1 Tax=Candidatus Hepatoplasma crinochetorum TaxID=295596 RepID=UPI003087EDCF|nr:MAG: hypothetical protein HCTKY_2310 [Candidatus Hepatoplasma crinochetorum]
MINEPLPDPEATVSNVIPTDVTINGGSDGSIGFDVTIANFVDLATAILNPATGTSPINLVDGVNADLSFDNLIAGTYVIEIYDGETLISSEADIVINEPLPDPEATVSNVVPIDVTVNGGSDGSIGFDVTIANFVDLATAILNPATGTSPISLVDGANADLSFDNLIAGTYTIEIYDGETLISSEADIVINEPLPDPEATVSNVIPTDVTVNGGSDGSIGFDVTIANFVDSATAILNPAAGTSPINLVDGVNADLSFDNLIAGTYVIEIYDGETLISSEADIVINEPLPDPEATVSNVIPTDVTINGGSDGSIGFDVTIANFVDLATAVLNPATGTSPISLVDGANTGLIFDNLIAGTYVIEIYDGEELISSEADIVVSEPNIGGNDFIPLTPEDDDANSKTSGEILDSYLNYDIILSKNQHPNYVGNGLFIGKEIDINDSNQSGITSNNEIQKLIFTDPTNFNLDIIGDFTGIYYLKGINVGLTPLITEGIYENNDNFTWLEDITQFNMIVQKWWDNTRNNFSYTLWEQTTDPEQNYIYVAKNAADTALNGWRFSNQEVSTGIGEGSYITMIYGFNFTSIDNLVISQTSDTFTLNDYTSYDLLLFKIEGSNFAVGDWVIKVSDIVADGITNHSYSNYQQEHFTITGNVLTWTSGGGLGHLELLGVKGIII